MRLSIRPQPVSRQLCYVLVLLGASLPAAFLYNPLLHEVSSAAEWGTALALSGLGLALGVFICHCCGRAGYVAAPVFALLLFSFTQVTVGYDLQPGPALIAACMETTPEEASAFFSPGLVLHGLLWITAYTLFVRITRRWFSFWNVFILLIFLVHLLGAQSRLFTRQATKEMRHASRWSMDYIADPVKYALDFPRKDKARVAELRDLPDPAAFPARRSPDDPLVIVLMIGESLRADHLALNGYGRPTTPLLATERLINFPRARSSAAWTRESVIGILTDRLPGAERSRHGSFVRIFQKLGFSVTTYSSNTKPNRSDFSLNVLTEGARRFYSPRPDMNMVLKFTGELGREQRELHILSPYGSHFSYRDAYPPEEAVFVPDAYAIPPTEKDIPALVNSYDNTVVYTDKVIAHILDLLRERNAVFIYVSDHGESLGEEGRFAHGDNKAPEQRHVPFFFWFSDSFRKDRGDMLEALASRTQEQVHHAHVFHTILGLAGIVTPARDPALDLSNVPVPEPE